MIGDFIYFDNDNDAMKRQQGFSSTDRDSFTSTETLTGVAWNGFDQKLYTGDNPNSQAQKHDGFSATQLETISITSIARMTFDNYGNLIVGLTAGGVTKYEGFSTTIISSINVGDCRGLAWEENEADQNLLNTDAGADDWEEFVGFTATVNRTQARGANDLGIAWDRLRNLSAGEATNPTTYKLFQGFTNTVDVSFTADSGDTGPTEHDFEKEYPVLQQIMSS